VPLSAQYGKGQLEITMAPAKGLQACDNAATYRSGVKELCQQRGLLASFFSYPFGAAGALAFGGRSRLTIPRLSTAVFVI
jgi:glutamine synthetase